MALDLAVGIDSGKRQPRVAAPYFLLGLNEEGLWLIRETTGRKAGLFRRLKDAVRYARDASPNGNFTIVYQPGGLEPERRSLRWAA